MAKIFTFTAAFKRDGQEVKQISGCATHEGFLGRVSGNIITPLWDSVSLEKAGLKPIDVDKIKTVQDAIRLGYSAQLIKFGKHDGYWVWNIEAAERKKIEADKTVYIYEKKQSPWDDDEPELRLSDKPYTKEVWAAITPHVRQDRRGYEVVNYSGLSTALQRIGWKLNK